MDVVERILIVDDDDLTAELYMAEIEAAGLGRPVVCTDSREVMTVVEEKEISLVLLDLHMPHIGGIELLSQMNEHAPHVTVIVITAIDRVDTAVECMKHGAFDFMSKPVDGPRLVTAVRHALRIRELEREVRAVLRSYATEYQPDASPYRAHGGPAVDGLVVLATSRREAREQIERLVTAPGTFELERLDDGADRS